MEKSIKQMTKTEVQDEIKRLENLEPSELNKLRLDMLRKAHK
jgi:hypothetical protein